MRAVKKAVDWSSAGSPTPAAGWTVCRALVLGIVVGFVGLSLAYNVVTPAGEGVDEIAHFEYTRAIKDQRALPHLTLTDPPGTVLMGYHPPLYYLIAAVLVSPLPTDQVAQALPSNPHFVWIEGYGPGNRNVFLHSPITGEDPFPYRGVILTIHLLRLFSTALGVGALLVAWALLRRLTAGRLGWAVAALAATAFQPTFVYVYSIAQNDGAVALCILLGMLWAVWVVERADRGESPPSAVLGGGILGLALLTKETTFTLGPVYALALVIQLARTRCWRTTLRLGAVVALVTMLVAGWWYGRNWLLYGDPLAQNLYRHFYGAFVRSTPYGWGDFVAFVQQLRRNFWGGFGYEHILIDGRISDTFWVIAAAAVPGFVLALIRRRGDRRYLDIWAVALASTVAFFAEFLHWSAIAGGGAAHGRFFVALIPILAAAVATGLGQWTPARWPVGPIGYAALVAALGIAAPVAVIAPAYRPPVARPADLAGATPQDRVFGDQLRLVATAMGPSRVAPGGSAALTLFWRRAAVVPADLRFEVQVRARDGTVFFRKDYWPAGGGVPTSTWPPGVTYRDALTIPVPPNVAPGPARVLLRVGTADGRWLAVAGPSAAGQSAFGDDEAGLGTEVGMLGITDLPLVATVPAGATPIGQNFGGTIDLVAYRLRGDVRPNGTVDATLYWRLDQPTAVNVTVSLQVLDPQGRLIAQNDAEPNAGKAPTSTWPVGALIADDHRVQLPPVLPAGRYGLSLVVYTRNPTITRLLLQQGSGGSDSLPLTHLQVQ